MSVRGVGLSAVAGIASFSWSVLWGRRARARASAWRETTAMAHGRVFMLLDRCRAAEASFGLRPVRSARSRPRVWCVRRRSDSEIRHGVALGLGSSGRPWRFAGTAVFVLGLPVLRLQNSGASFPFCQL